MSQFLSHLLLTALFVLSLSFLALAASFAEGPRSEMVAVSIAAQ